MSAQKPCLVSGIQPSGALGIGGYLGAVRQWVAMQQDHCCVFEIVDLHTLTIRQDPAVLRENCYDVLAWYLACGVDAEQHTIFLQSHVPEHAQLAWVLNCYAYMGELNRMTQFKDKSQSQGKNINVGLFTYPVLMAADILLYDANTVPVGEDQKQHLEITRDIAVRFNQLYGDIFTIPEPCIMGTGARVMGLQDPTKKMSKSTSSENDYLALIDEPKLIERKIKRAVTDSEGVVAYDPEGRPGISNLLNIYAAISDQSIESLVQQYEGQGYGQFKGDLAERLVALLQPIQQRHAALRADTHYLEQVLAAGAERAREQAAVTVRRVYDALGLIAP